MLPKGKPNYLWYVCLLSQLSTDVRKVIGNLFKVLQFIVDLRRCPCPDLACVTVIATTFRMLAGESLWGKNRKLT